MSIDMLDRWLFDLELATCLGISKETIYHWFDRKNVPAHRIWRLWRFKVSEVNKWVEEGGATDQLSEKNGY